MSNFANLLSIVNADALANVYKEAVVSKAEVTLAKSFISRISDQYGEGLDEVMGTLALAGLVQFLGNNDAIEAGISRTIARGGVSIAIDKAKELLFSDQMKAIFEDDVLTDNLSVDDIINRVNAYHAEKAAERSCYSLRFNNQKSGMQMQTIDLSLAPKVKGKLSVVGADKRTYNQIDALRKDFIKFNKQQCNITARSWPRLLTDGTVPTPDLSKVAETIVKFNNQRTKLSVNVLDLNKKITDKMLAFNEQGTDEAVANIVEKADVPAVPAPTTSDVPFDETPELKFPVTKDQVKNADGTYYCPRCKASVKKNALQIYTPKKLPEGAVIPEEVAMWGGSVLCGTCRDKIKVDHDKAFADINERTQTYNTMSKQADENMAKALELEESTKATAARLKELEAIEKAMKGNTPPSIADEAKTLRFNTQQVKSQIQTLIADAEAYTKKAEEAMPSKAATVPAATVPAEKTEAEVKVTPAPAPVVETKMADKIAEAITGATSKTNTRVKGGRKGRGRK